MGTQLNRTAVMPNSFPMEGRAILIEEPMKGTKKEGRVVANKTAFLSIGPGRSMALIIIEGKGIYEEPIDCYNRIVIKGCYTSEV
jgi:hypothetical protein